MVPSRIFITVKKTKLSKSIVLLLLFLRNNFLPLLASNFYQVLIASLVLNH